MAMCAVACRRHAVTKGAVACAVPLDNALICKQVQRAVQCNLVERAMAAQGFQYILCAQGTFFSNENGENADAGICGIHSALFQSQLQFTQVGLIRFGMVRFIGKWFDVIGGRRHAIFLLHRIVCVTASNAMATKKQVAATAMMDAPEVMSK